MTLLVLDKIDKESQRKLFSIMGVDVCLSSHGWLHPLLMLIAGIVLAFIFAPVAGMGAKLIAGVGYGVLLIAMLIVHELGHIISSQMVGAPMTSLVLTATVGIGQYEDSEEPSSRVHVGRSLGGPVANLIVGLICLLLFASNHYLQFFGAMNLLLAIVAILPIPTLDGAVIFRELRNWRK